MRLVRVADGNEVTQEVSCVPEDPGDEHNHNKSLIFEQP